MVRDWILVSVWSAIIFLTIPFARAVQKLVAGSSIGSEAFHYLVIAVLLVALVLALGAMRRRSAVKSQYFALLLVIGIFAKYTLELKSSPEEAVHFVEYGVLAILIYRALSHSIGDPTIYLTSAAIGASIGILDEVIQWLTPKRFWDLRDIWLNFFGVALTMAGIAFGWRPPSIALPITEKGIRWFCRAAAVALVLLLANLVNTPARFRWEYIEAQGDQMVEYGHLHRDPEIGLFRSRFTLEELAWTDDKRAVEAAAILDQYATGESYAAFLATYPANVDPFLHEMRVHIFRRDHYARLAGEHQGEEARRDAAIAVRENQILERYFDRTLSHSTLKWPREKVEELTNNAALEGTYESPVSQQLFTRFSEVQIVTALTIALLSLYVLHRNAARVAGRAARSA